MAANYTVVKEFPADPAHPVKLEVFIPDGNGGFSSPDGAVLWTLDHGDAGVLSGANPPSGTARNFTSNGHVIWVAAHAQFDVNTGTGVDTAIVDFLLHPYPPANSVYGTATIL